MRIVTPVSEFFFLFFSTLPICASSEYHNTYFSLITSVHSYFGTSCVFVVHGAQESMGGFLRIHELLKKLSEDNVLAVPVEIGRLHETMQFYSGRVLRALIVVALQSTEVVGKFSNLTSAFHMTSMCWLLIFDENVYRDNSPSHLPGENIFHLTFNTEMMVARSNYSVIEEWYWLKDRVQVDDLALWDFDMEFTLLSNESLYERRGTLENSPIIVATLNNPPLISFVNNTNGGLFGEILTELSKAINSELRFVVPSDRTYGNWKPHEKQWTGMIDMLIKGKANIAAGDFTITTQRLEFVDFTLPLISTSNKLYVRQPDGGIQWSAYWQTFTPGIWISVQLMILVTTIVLILIAGSKRCIFNTCAEYLLLVFGIYCQQGLSHFPEDMPSRVTFFSLYLSALVVCAAYAASLISYLTVTRESLPFSTLEGFVNDGSYKLIVFKNSAEHDMLEHATETVMIKMRSLLKYRSLLPTTLESGFRQVCEEKTAFFVPAALYDTISDYLPCKLIGIDTKQRTSLAMALSKRNPFNGLINYHIQRFRDNGILSRLKQNYEVEKEPVAKSLSQVTLWGVIPVLAILAGGVVLATIILLTERMFFGRRRPAEN
ncbi:glutamate receptor 1-like isoform X2 [Athalia rosae]|uniref:glutamate receptor 1-like isoform X2 n=1 Tax=Athalia rosae TaxID=37344 RepID=UPI00203353B1|nr:glutamate receptor 1-like isoform X2 [Athalia rosae]